MIKFIFHTLFITLLISIDLHANNGLSVPSLFSDNMVLQRNAKVSFWGNSSPSAKVIIKTPWKEYYGYSDHEGAWNIPIKTKELSAPFTISICAQKNCIEIKNVVLGEVWLASGQSNMEMPLKGWLPKDPVLDSEVEINSAYKFPVRFFTVKHSLSTQPQNKLTGKWNLGTTKNAANFSATAYFFAKELTKTLGVPIGIIHSSWGGTPVQSWIGADGLRATGYFNDILDKLPDLERYKKNYEIWLSQLESFASPFKSIPNEWTKKAESLWRTLQFDDFKYAEPNFKDTPWAEVTLPGNYIPNHNGKPLNDYDGIVWLRKSFFIDTVDEDLELTLGLVDDLEFTFVNGVAVGATMGPRSFSEKKYKIPKEILKKGENSIAIRAIDTGGGASILSPINLKNNTTKISLEGQWKALPIAEYYNHNFYKLNSNKTTISKRPTVIKITSWTPAALYNAMINPLIKFTIKGVIWYQGESNVGEHQTYTTVFEAMIKHWRSKWGYDFPFYFAQIAPYDYNNNLSPALRNAQMKVSNTKNTGMAVTLDIGNPKNIHPENKQAVGERLAALAFKNTYGISGDYGASKPISIRSNQNQLIIKFNCDEGGISYVEGKKEELQISSDGVNYYIANVVIDNCTIYVSAVEVKDPKYIRHAWSDISTGALFNSLNIPISTFYLKTE